jgi:site-specific recombinase XerD
MGKILPSEIQRWVTTASATEDGNGLSAASVRKYHTMLHSVFERALRDRVVTFNPCAHTELPKVIKKKTRTLNPEEYVAILHVLPDADAKNLDALRRVRGTTAFTADSPDAANDADQAEP